MIPYTFMVKTILRPVALELMLRSLRKFFPDAPVVIADDSPEPYPEIGEKYGCSHHLFDPDIGIGHCYNWMVDNWIETPYLVLLDDDFVFTEDTKIDNFVPWLDAGVVDLIGGDVFNVPRRCFQGFIGRFECSNKKGRIAPNTITLRKYRREWIRHIVGIDVTMNFWMATTESVRKTRWDEALKVCRHEDFFLRYIGYKPKEDRVEGYRAAFMKGVVVHHDNKSARNAAYQALRRDRFPQFRQVFIEKWGFEFV